MTRSTALSNLGLLASTLLGIAITGELCMRALLAVGWVAEPRGTIIFPDVRIAASAWAEMISEFASRASS